MFRGHGNEISPATPDRNVILGRKWTLVLTVVWDVPLLNGPTILRRWVRGTDWTWNMEQRIMKERNNKTREAYVQQWTVIGLLFFPKLWLVFVWKTNIHPSIHLQKKILFIIVTRSKILICVYFRINLYHKQTCLPILWINVVQLKSEWSRSTLRHGCHFIYILLVTHLKIPLLMVTC